LSKQIIEGYFALNKGNIIMIFHTRFSDHLEFFQHFNITLEGTTLMHLKSLFPLQQRVTNLRIFRWIAGQFIQIQFW